MNSKGIWFGDYLFDPAYENVLHDFKAMGEQLGFSVRHSRDQVDCICLINFHLRDVLRLVFRRSLRNINSRLHVVTEPRVIVPALGFKFWRQLRLKRITLGGTTGMETKYEKPYQTTEILAIGKRLDRAVIVNANKFSWVKGEFYSLRRMVLSKDFNVDIYGEGWRAPKLRLIRTQAFELLRALVSPERVSFGGRLALSRFENSLGTCEDKRLTIGQYKVNLVIENSTELVTEKLVDAWVAGCIPVYVGPDLGPHGIPDSTYIKASPTLKGVQEALEIALSTEHEIFHQEVSNWLASRQFQDNWGYFQGWKKVLDPLLN